MFRLFVEAETGKRPGVGMLLRRPELRIAGIGLNESDRRPDGVKRFGLMALGRGDADSSSSMCGFLCVLNERRISVVGVPVWTISSALEPASVDA